jgi:hypothetical protein
LWFKFLRAKTFKGVTFKGGRFFLLLEVNVEWPKRTVHMDSTHGQYTWTGDIELFWLGRGHFFSLKKN